MKKDEGWFEDNDFGTCCACGEAGTEDNPVRNGIMLRVRGPSPGKGWGCFTCGLPLDGAMAFICDRCLELGFEKAQIRWVVEGLVADKGRVSIDVCTEFFDHDMSKHEHEDEVPFCEEHQCEMLLTDYDDDSRYECPECRREDGEALGLK